MHFSLGMNRVVSELGLRRAIEVYAKFEGNEVRRKTSSFRLPYQVFSLGCLCGHLAGGLVRYSLASDRKTTPKTLLGGQTSQMYYWCLNSAGNVPGVSEWVRDGETQTARYWSRNCVGSVAFKDASGTKNQWRGRKNLIIKQGYLGINIPHTG